MRSIWLSWMRKNDPRPNPLMVLPRLQNTSTLVQTQTDPMSHCIADRTWNYFQTWIKKLGWDVEELKKSDWNDEILRLETIYKNVRVEGMMGNYNPRSLAGGLIYRLAVKMRLEITQKQIAEVSGLARPTIRRHYDTWKQWEIDYA